MRLKVLLAILCTLSLLLPLLPPPAFAQYLGQVSIQTVQAQLASNVTCTGNVQNFITNQGIPNFNNLGQTYHQVSATSAASTFTVEIDGIDVLGNVVRISSPTISYQPTSLINGYVGQGTGYYPNIQVSVTCTMGATFSMTYSGSTGGGTPIIATPGLNPFTPQATVAADVQGIVPPNINGNGTYPLLLGGLDPATNAQVSAAGVDTFLATGRFVASGITGTATFPAPPQASAGAGAFAFMYYGPIQSVGATSLAAPWNCLAGCNTSTVNGGAAADLANYTIKNSPVQNYVNSTAGTIGQLYVIFPKAPTIANSNFLSGAGGTLTVTKGDTILIGFNCIATGAGTSGTCGVTAVTDTFGSSFRTVPAVAVGNSASGNIIFNAYVAIANNTGSDTITITQAGTAPGTSLLDLQNVSAAAPNTPSTPLFNSNRTFTANEDDNGGLFTNAGGFDLTQTVTLGTGTTTFPLWAQPQHGIYYSCTAALRVTAASGTTPTLNTYLQDSGDNVGFNDRLSFPQAVAAGNFLGAVSGGVGGITPAATTDGVLAAGSKLDGPLSAFGRIKFVVGGTTPSFTVTYNVACR